VSAPKSARTAEPWVDAVAVATHIKASRSYILDLALRGEIPCAALPSKGGKRTTYRFRIGEVDAWLEARRVRAVAS
jgi:hypothetical protein